ncbi:hypothetical protein HK096_000239, partial [Nowakowskiella sp. JEL0078]
MTERTHFANTQNMEDSGMSMESGSVSISIAPKNFHAIDSKDEAIEFQIPTSVLSPGSDEKDPFNGLSELDYNPVVEMPARPPTRLARQQWIPTRPE